MAILAVVKGWMSKTDIHNGKYVHNFSDVIFPGIFKKKGGKWDWHPSAWPPIKVKVTLETFEDSK